MYLNHIQVKNRWLIRIINLVTIHEESQLLLAFDIEAENTLFLKYLKKHFCHHLLDWKEICIRFLRIEYFVTVHNRH